MGKKFFVSLAVLAGLMLGQIASSQSDFEIRQSDQPQRPREISPGQFSDLQMEAARGSGSAARDLARTYMLFGNHKEEAEYWSTIGAENGDVVCMYNLWTFLAEKKDQLSRTRGIFWLQKAAALGDEASKRKLESLSKKGSQG